MQHLPLLRLLDHRDAADGPSEAEEEEKDAKRQRSASTTPRSTSGTLLHEYDMVMGIAPVEPQESERFEEGNDSDFRDAEGTTTREPDTGENADTDTLGPGEIHGGFGSASLQECVGRVLHNPPQVMSPNVEQNQPQETTSLAISRRCATPSCKGGEAKERCDT